MINLAELARAAHMRPALAKPTDVAECLVDAITQDEHALRLACRAGASARRSLVAARLGGIEWILAAETARRVAELLQDAPESLDWRLKLNAECAARLVEAADRADQLRAWLVRGAH